MNSSEDWCASPMIFHVSLMILTKMSCITRRETIENWGLSLLKKEAALCIEFAFLAYFLNIFCVLWSSSEFSTGSLVEVNYYVCMLNTKFRWARDGASFKIRDLFILFRIYMLRRFHVLRRMPLRLKSALSCCIWLVQRASGSFTEHLLNSQVVVLFMVFAEKDSPETEIYCL